MPMEGRQILIVDDEDLLRELVAEVLADAGYTVREAKDGTVAITSLAQEGAPDLMLLDLGMKGIDGWGVLKEVAALSHPPRVLIMTGRGEIVPPGKLAAYVTGHLHKPFPPDELLKACAVALDTPGTKPTHDRRREPRRGYTSEGTLRAADGADLGLAQLVQVSTHGFRVEMPMPALPGDRIVLDVSMPGRERPLRLIGRVRWRRGAVLGAELEEIDPRDAEILRELTAE
jgi:two-component system, OmpR family, alkaline phosphatase synthesis response regulator PhoP